MKKNILLAAGAVLLAAAVSAFVYVKNENNSMNELFNANVEALARGESGGYVMCMQYLTESDHGERNYYCPTCRLITCGQTSMAMCTPK